jgi:hypothetical protein
MIFSVQRFLEDYLRGRGLHDGDQYAIKIANLYTRSRRSETRLGFMKRIRRVRTTFFRNNPQIARGKLEREVLGALDREFRGGQAGQPGLFAQPEAKAERARLRGMPKQSIGAILRSFQRGTVARNIDIFWNSRKAGKLRTRPEKIAQSLLIEFLSGVISRGKGNLFREVASGIGFVDIVVMLATTQHVVELKILKGKFSGPAQLATYMSNQGRRVGWLVVFDARKPSKKNPVPTVIQSPAGVINVIVVDINPVPPSRKK